MRWWPIILAAAEEPKGLPDGIDPEALLNGRKDKYARIIEVWILIERHFGCDKKSTVYAVCICESKHCNGYKKRICGMH